MCTKNVFLFFALSDMVKYKEVEVAVGEELTVVRMILDINHNVVIGSFPGLCVT